MYFLPAVGWEKVIQIRHFSNETAIFQLPILVINSQILRNFAVNIKWNCYS
ncbi:MAG: hypothetical protein LBR79_00755 [Oscillospiraceae bacterium]|nr:hypothetical protein [Oscillospiraceae bacterium]